MRKIRELPPRELVQSLISYDPITGIFQRNGKTIRHNGRSYNGNNQYLDITIQGKQYRAHRLAWLLIHGKPIPDIIDHKDRNSLNNAISNLRAASNAQNVTNARIRCNNTSGALGVVNCIPKGYRASVVVDGISCGSKVFDTLQEAVQWRERVARMIYGPFSPHINYGEINDG